MAASLSSSYRDDDDGSLSDINVTPLVDVVLVLLIVFMITVPAIVGSARVKVDLPETTAVAANSEILPFVFALRPGENGEPVMLDIKEAAQEGMGPHGLCVGATGSGKSELLRTLVLGLAVTHSSETLNFVLADFKGGATFAGMAEMPHVAAVITNLADDLTLVDRMRDAITGELQRRQELLRAAGNFANIHDDEKARGAGAADGRTRASGRRTGRRRATALCRGPARG